MSIESLPDLQVDETLRQQFKTGSLAGEWREKYPEIFDHDDLRLALSQPFYHFYEWFAALHLYQDKGYFFSY